MATVLVTGASRGIGSELVKQYAAEGADVIACVRDPAAPGLAGVGGNVRILRLDTGDPGSIAAAAEQVGDQPLDVLINNAGAVGGDPATQQSMDSLDLDEWHNTLNINTIGPVLIARALKANLAASGDGKLLHVTSQLAASTWPIGGMYIYSTTKAALSKAAQIMALDWKEDPITVALVHPGWVRTDMGGPHADISAEESASGIRTLVASLTKADSGKFFKWNGEIHPW